MGGKVPHPTYEQVCSDETGHAEVVQVTFDPRKVTYEQVLDLFWRLHDPTTSTARDTTWGLQYRSAIFYHSEPSARRRSARRRRRPRGSPGPSSPRSPPPVPSTRQRATTRTTTG